jgi:hypothetical protein
LQESVFFELAREGAEPGSTDIYLALKFSAAMIDRTAHRFKTFGDLQASPIKFPFHNQMQDTFVAFDARQRLDCISNHIAGELDLAYEKSTGAITDYYPLHNIKAYDEMRAQLSK